MSRSGKKSRKGSKKINNKAVNQPNIDEASKNDEKSVAEKVSDIIEKNEVDNESLPESAEKLVEENVPASTETASLQAEDIAAEAAESEASENPEITEPEEQSDSTAEDTEETEPEAVEAEESEVSEKPEFIEAEEQSDSTAEDTEETEPEAVEAEESEASEKPEFTEAEEQSDSTAEDTVETEPEAVEAEESEASEKPEFTEPEEQSDSTAEDTEETEPEAVEAADAAESEVSEKTEFTEPEEQSDSTAEDTEETEPEAVEAVETEESEASEKPMFGASEAEDNTAEYITAEPVYEESQPEEAEDDPDAYIDPDIELSIDMIPTANYALQQNGLELVKSIIIKNSKNEPVKDIELVITSADQLCLPFIMHIEYISENSDFEIKHTALRLNGDKLVSLTEAVKGNILFELTKDGKTISRLTKEINILAYDECTGFGIYPELLCSFVTPNHPEIVGIISKASTLLEEWTGDPSFTGYQSCDPNVALKQAAAIYGAIEAQNIVYSEPPASFEASGQRIRLCDSILSQKLGTCMDMTLLYASALELVGLHPLLIMKKGHIFAGVWLEDMTFPEAVQDDPALLRKKLADGVNEIAVVECTHMNAGKSVSFDDASKAAMKEVPEALCIIDVKRSRYSGIKPLPVRIKTDSGWTVQRDEKEDGELTGIPKELGSVISIDETRTAPLTKLQQWERKLLDLGLRNSLINFRMSKTTVPLIISSVDDLEDALADGEDFTVMPRPEEIRVSGNIGFESLDDIGECSEIVKSEFKNHRLRSLFTETELANTIKEIYRASKVAMEENGANTLYIALGLLRWYENPKSTKARYAPILLLPVEIVRKSAAKGYTIRLRDEDPVMNITLLEKLKQDFEIEINGLDPLPLDEHGIDTRKVFTIIRKAVMDRKNWDVNESAYLGIFSFSQFVMWNDLRNRSDELSENKIVKSLMDGKLSWKAQEMEIGRRVPEDEVLLPMPADASQLFAIEAAGKGESFVLHGPPGTGKSQTITALIANALAQGKTVLFVAEKMAALEVVQKRLDKIGIGDFCLELHSNKSKKKAVLEQLRKASEVTKSKSSRTFAQKAEMLSELRHELDIYAGALHRRQPCGKSLYHLINDYQANINYPELPAFDEDFVKHIDAETIEKQEVMLERLIAAAKATGHPKDHPLAPIGVKIYSQHFRMQLPNELADYKEALEAVREPLKAFAESSSQPTDTYAQSKKTVDLAREAAVWFDMPKAWAKNENITNYMFGIWELCEHSISAKQLRTKLGTNWKSDFFSLDGRALLNEFREDNTKWFLAKSMSLGKLHKKISQYSETPVDKNSLETILTDLMNYQTEKSEADRLFSMYGNDLGNLYNGENTNWQDVSKHSDRAKESAAKLQEITGSDEFRMTYCGNTDAKDVIPVLLDNWEKLEKVRSSFYGFLELRTSDSENWIEHDISLCDTISEHSDEIKEWITWNDISEEAESAGLLPAVTAYRDGMAHSDMKGAYIKTISKALAIKAIDGSSALNKFSGPLFNEKIEQFRRMDREITSLTRQEIYCRLASKVPNFSREAAQSSELGILQKAIRSGGRGISIRKLFDQLPNMLPRLCPCMLMSPISAAQYLDPKREPFDIVVFDEASQLPTCKAVGVLARGKNAVIVGDPKQMPPTSFFSNTSVDEDNLDIEDLESILDDCLALNMPQTHLLWHYRSRHESLIAFSNHEFYENKLYTFPSVNDREEKVRLVHVDGVFERGKTRNNLEEAKAVVEELKRRAHDENDSKYSVGIVTFNVNQQNLIDDLLTEACTEDPELEAWAYNSEEPIFIKNLENVQGDERDVILFSVGYGPDKNGRVSMNFGPLNREGGWRRLNVAVSRARCEMIVYSSLTADMIDLSRTAADGVAALRSFLAYASGKPLISDGNSVAADKNNIKGIADTICSHIEEKGYKTDRMVGNSEYRIDIGVIDPNEPEKYMLGILLDGLSYGRSKTTRDRELAQTGILDGLGWKIMRVWSMDWWDNSKKELARIDEELEKLSSGNLEDFVSDEDENEPEFTPFDEPEPQEIVSYEITKLTYNTVTPDELMTQKHSDSLRKKLRKVIETEAPINKELVIRRVMDSFDIIRSTPKLHRYIDDVVAAMTYPKTTQSEEMQIIWSDTVKPTGYAAYRPNGTGDNNREVTDVPYAEAANAVLAILYDEVSLPKADLVKESAKLMNYRMGSNVSAVFTAAVDLVIEKKLAYVDENEICGLTEEGMELMNSR